MTTARSVDLGTLFDGASRSVVRVETLPTYDVGGDEAESLAAWRAGRPRPERSVRTNRYLQRVAAAVARGVVWERLRVIDSPPSDYQRWELLAYQESQAVGETVMLAERIDVPAGVEGEDVWIVDDHAVALDYDLRGRFLGNHAIDLEDSLAVAAEVRAAAVPLNVYLAGAGAVPRAS